MTYGPWLYREDPKTSHYQSSGLLIDILQVTHRAGEVLMMLQQLLLGMHRSDTEDRYRLRSSHFLRIGYRSDESDPVLLSVYYSVLLLSPREATKTS